METAHGKVLGLVAEHVMVSQIMKCHADAKQSKSRKGGLGPR